MYIHIVLVCTYCKCFYKHTGSADWNYPYSGLWNVYIRYIRILCFSLCIIHDVLYTYSVVMSGFQFTDLIIARQHVLVYKFCSYVCNEYKINIQWMIDDRCMLCIHNSECHSVFETCNIYVDREKLIYIYIRDHYVHSTPPILEY